MRRRELLPEAVQRFLSTTVIIPRQISVYDTGGRTVAHNVSGIQYLLQHLKHEDPITYRMYQQTFPVTPEFTRQVHAHEINAQTLEYVRMRDHLDPLILVELDTGETIIADGRHRARVIVERGHRDFPAFHIPYDLAYRFELDQAIVRAMRRPA